MVVSIILQAVPIKGGTYKPSFILMENHYNKATSIEFYTDKLFDKEEDALENARKHAIAEAKQRYSDDTKVVIADRKESKTVKK